MATTYEEAKSATFINDIIRFVEELLGIRFWKTGKLTYSAYCPFHDDRRDSFRVYVNPEDVVRFHCFGCKKDCDVYELIQSNNKCSFPEAQKIFADYLGIKDFVFYKRGDSKATISEKQDAEDDLISFIEPPAPDPQIFPSKKRRGYQRPFDRRTLPSIRPCRPAQVCRVPLRCPELQKVRRSTSHASA